MQERSEWAIDQGRRLVEREFAHVSLVQVELHSRLGRTGASLVEHRWRRINAYDPLTSRSCDRDRDPPVPNRQLDKRPSCLDGEFSVEGNVGSHVSRPFLVAVREYLVPTHRSILVLSTITDHQSETSMGTAINRLKAACGASGPAPAACQGVGLVRRRRAKLDVGRTVTDP